MQQLSDLTLFLAVSQHGSIAGAARAVGTTRATAARRLAALEDHLGVQLVHRDTRTLSLTQAGQTFLAHAEGIVRSIREAESAVRELDDVPRGLLRLAVPSISVERILHPLLSGFAQQYPEISFELVFEVDIRQMVEQGFDVGLQIGLEANASLVMKTLLRERLFLVASPAYIARHEPIVSVEDLADHACLIYRQPDGTRESWPLADGGVYTVEQPYVLANSFHLLHHMALSGMGISLASSTLVGPEIAQGVLVPVLPDLIGKNEMVVLVYPATRHVPPKVRALIDFTTAWVEGLAC